MSRKKSLENLFEKYVDIPIIARAVLGKSWREANSDQRKRFIDAFKGYVSNKYGRQFSEFKGTTLEIVEYSRYSDKSWCTCIDRSCCARWNLH